jgi:hypothetical protein
MKESKIFIRKITNDQIKLTHIGENRPIADEYLIHHLREIFEFLKSVLYNTKTTFLIPLWENDHANHDASFILGKILEDNGNEKHFIFSNL